MLVLATLWPEFWNTLTARPPGDGADPHAQARELLEGRDISVPLAFTAAQLQQARETGDPRLAQAAAGAEDGQVIQFLAGAPELLAQYRNAPPAAKALINTAMDARRLGAGISLPLAFLEAAAPGYMNDAEWDALSEDWLEQALTYTAASRKGARGPLDSHPPPPNTTRLHRERCAAGWRPGQCPGNAALPARGLPGSARPPPLERPVPSARLLGRSGRLRLPQRSSRAR